MASEIRKLGKHALVYGAGIAIGRLAGFIMLPIYTSFLSESDYGTLELLTLTVDFLGTIASIGVSGAVYKYYTDAEHERDRRRLISTATLTLVGLKSVLCLAGYFAAAPLTDLVLGTDAPTWYFQLFFLIYFLQSAETVPLLYLRAREQSVAFALINVGRLIVSLGLNIYFVVFLELGVPGVLYASAITGAIFSAGLLVYQFRETGVAWDGGRARALMRFGAPMIPWTLANFLIVFSDRYFLKGYSGEAAVGVYSLAFRFGMLLHAFGFKPFHLVWGPQRFEVAKQSDGNRTIRRVFEYLNLTLGYVALLIALFSGDVIRVMAQRPGFHEAAGLVPILVTAQILYHLVSFPNLSMLVTERTKVLGGLAFVTAGIVLAFNFALIPRYGMYGAAWATLLAYGCRFLIVLAVGQRIRPFEYGWARIARIYLILAVPFAVKLFAPIEAVVWSVAQSAGLGLATAAVLYVLVLDDSERRAVRTFPGRMIARIRGGGVS